MTISNIKLNSLNIVSLNIQGINNKKRELLLLAEENKLDFICLQETFLKKDKSFEGYNPEFSHRENRRGGGVGILIKKDISYSEVKLNCCNTCDNEYIAISTITNNKPLLICTIYAPEGKHCSNLHSLIKNLKYHYKIL